MINAIDRNAIMDILRGEIMQWDDYWFVRLDVIDKIADYLEGDRGKVWYDPQGFDAEVWRIRAKGGS